MDRLVRPGRRTAQKVFGIGILKTGTTSLGEALRLLGYRNTHENRDQLLKSLSKGSLRKTLRWADQYDSFEDWPWPLIYRELDRAYPASRFILTVRESEDRWYESICRHDEVVGPTLGRRLFFGAGSPAANREAYLSRYREHIDQVQAYFATRPEKLLTVCWENGDAWEGLCDFLGKAVPDASFPVLNTASERIDK